MDCTFFSHAHSYPDGRPALPPEPKASITNHKFT